MDSDLMSFDWLTFEGYQRAWFNPFLWWLIPEVKKVSAHHSQKMLLIAARPQESCFSNSWIFTCFLLGVLIKEKIILSKAGYLFLICGLTVSVLNCLNDLTVFRNCLQELFLWKSVLPWGETLSIFYLCYMDNSFKLYSLKSTFL